MKTDNVNKIRCNDSRQKQNIMKLFILTPNADTLFTKDQLKSLDAAGDVTIYTDIKPLADLRELYAGDEPRVVAVDPDFTDWTFPNDVIDKMPNLKALCLQTTGFNWVDVDHLSQKNIPVTHLLGFSTVAVAEWATFMTLAVARRLPLVAKDNWKLDYDRHRGFELRGKTAGIVGLGRIGTAIAENMAGLGMKVQYWSRSSEDTRFEKVSLKELVKTSDVIIPATASNEETKVLISDDMLATMRPTAVVVGVVEPIFSHKLLIKMVQSGKAGGYAFEDEKGPFGKYEGNVWNGPALGWCTDESLSKNGELWVESIVNAAKGTFPTRI
jgi:lactate dehydrogenase-like 2-hydroxyacid dehydrogenase